MRQKTPLDRAIDLAGGVDAFCARFAIKRRSLFYWRSGRLPAEKAIAIERDLGVPARELLPELFGQQKAGAT